LLPSGASESLSAVTEPRSRWGGPAKLLVALGGALFLALLAYGLTATGPQTGIDDGLAEGQAVPAPGFELPVLQAGSPGARLKEVVGSAASDGRVALSELRGTPVVLNFWASWCTPCREEAPLLEQGWRDGRRRGVAFVGLNMQDLTGDARAFMGEFDNTYLNVRDQGNAVALEWGVTGLPETFFIAANGYVVAHVIGAVSAEQLEHGIAAAENGRPLGALEGGERREVR
jgi:cytochrome c biogenesis protein CcmG, thiol:disulfide interchange protein DsbE